MAFKITIEEIKPVLRRERTYSEGEDAPKEFREFERDETTDVYTQVVDSVDLVKVISAVNWEKDTK
jgi:hypothetical protein